MNGLEAAMALFGMGLLPMIFGACALADRARRLGLWLLTIGVLLTVPAVLRLLALAVFS